MPGPVKTHPQKTRAPDNSLLYSRSWIQSGHCLKMSCSVDHMERSTSFFDLPLHIRERIYECAGLSRPCTINLVEESTRIKPGIGEASTCFILPFPYWMSGYARNSQPRQPPCNHPALPLNLLLVSRAVRYEAKSFFLTRNRFRLRLADRKDLQFFMSSSSYLPQLSCLSVDLCFKDNRYIKNTHDTKIFVWAKFCRGSVDGLPNLRAFSLRARVKDSETALELLGHMSEFRPLHDCAFYFDIREKGDILPVMRQTAHEVTSPSRYRPGVFNFFDLPKELQLMVHENLVGSRWDPFLHSSAPARGVIALLNRKSVRAHLPTKRCCKTCSIMNTGCFCSENRQMAYSTSCSCFTSPLPYFLVSREFYEDSRATYFRMNHFAFMEDCSRTMMQIMRAIPTPSLAQIRRLTLRFPHSMSLRSSPHRMGPSSSWSEVLRFIRKHFKLSRLSVTAIIIEPANITQLPWLLRSFNKLKGVKEFRLYLGNNTHLEQRVEKDVMSIMREEDYKPKDDTVWVPLFGTRSDLGRY